MNRPIFTLFYELVGVHKQIEYFYTLNQKPDKRGYFLPVCISISASSSGRAYQGGQSEPRT